jgi:hypothetical protein
LSRTYGISRFFLLFAAVWMAALTWKVYPQFKDTLRVDGRVVTLDDYIEAACSERVGPFATVCRATSLEHGRRLVAAEQAKMLLLVQAPLIAYVVVYLPFHWLRRRARRPETASGTTEHVR